MTTSPASEQSAARPMNGAAARAPQVLVWDWPLRVFHWALALLVVGLWFTAENGYLGLHKRFGLTVLGLLVFRVYWGFAGAGTARFSQFVKGPRAVLAYGRELRRPYKARRGHNPLGAMSVLAMLAALMAQVAAGLFAVDVDGLESGPLSRFVTFEQGRMAAEFHETWFNVVFGLIVLHLAAVAFYAIFLRTNLAAAMITGRRPMDHEPDAPAPPAAVPLWRAALGVLIAGAVIMIVS